MEQATVDDAVLYDLQRLSASAGGPSREFAADAEREPLPKLPTQPQNAAKRELRTWTSADGQYSLVAALAASKDGWVQLERESGERISVPLTKLSAEDVEYVTGEPPRKLIEGEVVSITDGDTIVVLDAQETQHKIRLEGIDAPESGQDYGTQARKALAAKVFRKRVRVLWEEEDRYKRILGHIYLDDRWINKEMVEEGWAWHYVAYNDDERLAAAQKTSETRRAGLWADSNRPTPPWIFRHPAKLAEYNRKLAAEAQRALPEREPPTASGLRPQTAVESYWLNTSSNVRHNRGCRWYNNTKRGRPCGPNEGRACGICGG